MLDILTLPNRSKMKSRLLIVLLSISTVVFAQTEANIEGSVTGFMKSVWGSTLQEVEQNNSGKGYVYMDGFEDILAVSSVEFAGFDDCTIAWYFTSNQLFQGKVIYTPSLEARAMEEYDSFKSKIDSKYGLGERYEFYDYPYEKGDGHWETAFKIGKGTLFSYWMDNEENIITLKLDEDLNVTLTYQNSSLVEKAVEEKEAAESEDL